MNNSAKVLESLKLEIADMNSLVKTSAIDGLEKAVNLGGKFKVAQDHINETTDKKDRSKTFAEFVESTGFKKAWVYRLIQAYTVWPGCKDSLDKLESVTIDGLIKLASRLEKEASPNYDPEVEAAERTAKAQAKAEKAKATKEAVDELERLRQMVQQLKSENNNLKATLRSYEKGQSKEKPKEEPKEQPRGNSTVLDAKVRNRVKKTWATMVHATTDPGTFSAALNVLQEIAKKYGMTLDQLATACGCNPADLHRKQAA